MPTNNLTDQALIQESSELEPYEAADRAARLAYGRLIAVLCRSGAALTHAEDALSDAFVRALERWPNHGVPDSPEAWLLTTARRLIIDQARHQTMRQQTLPNLIDAMDELEQQVTGEGQVHDRRLDLMLMCAHPVVSIAARAPLMLQTVLGMTAEAMSKAFLLSPSTLGQRLARAKRRLAEVSVSFTAPSVEDYDERIQHVLEAIYAAYSTSWNSIEDAKDVRHGMAHEAIWLAQIVCQHRPNNAEAHGLLSLMLFAQSRVHARRNAQDEYVPLSEQSRDSWDWQLIAVAEHHASCAVTLNSIGRFQLEAAIQSHHVQCDPTLGPDWKAIVRLYDGLNNLAPTMATLVGRAAAVAQVNGAQAGLDALELVDASRRNLFQPYWAVKAHLLTMLKQNAAAAVAYRQAMGLCEDDSVRRFLLSKHDALSSDRLD